MLVNALLRCFARKIYMAKGQSRFAFETVAACSGVKWDWDFTSQFLTAVCPPKLHIYIKT